MASRFEQMAKGNEIIIGEETLRQAGDEFSVKEKGEILLKNKNQPVKCYLVLE